MKLKKLFLFTTYADIPLKVIDTTKVKTQYIEFTFMDYYGPRKIVNFKIHRKYSNLNL